MEAHAKSIRQILESGSQFLIPFFQRSYSWRKGHWKRLWEDVINLSEDGNRSQHFLGPLVCTVEKAIPGAPSVYLLIDGQQRLTTLTLLLAALRDVATQSDDPKLAAKIHEGYLVHRHEEGLQRYKILPRIGDREVLMGIIDQATKKDHDQSPVVTAYRYFSRQLNEFVADPNNSATFAKMFAIVADQLALVVITIDGENPFEIFESLNSTGLPLEESDLVRNFLFMQVPLAKQEAFNSQCWKEFEAIFPGAESGKLATAFYRHYLMRNGEYSKAKSTFVDFKNLSRTSPMTPELRVKELTRFAEFDRILRDPDLCEQIKIREALCDITRLDVTTAYPLILNLFDRHSAGSLPEDEFVGCLTDLASFVLRRSICGESTRAYGRWFVEAIKFIEAQPRTELQQYWFKRGWPDDATVCRNLASFPVYRREPKKLKLILESIEIAEGHKEQVPFDDLQIEHVMPQAIGNNADGKNWKEMLGDSWKEVHDSLLHTIGNLTLTGYNLKLSNRSYGWKRGELANSHLELNKYFSTRPAWTKEAIETRTQLLATSVTTLWPKPEGGPAYVPSPESAEATRNVLEQYWSAFAVRFEAACPDLKLDRPCIPSYKGLKGPRQCFWYMFSVLPEERMISVGIETSGKYRQQWLALLWDNITSDEQGFLESDTGAACWWHADYPQMYLLRDEMDVRNQKEWAEQHDWMCRTFLRLHSLVGDRIPALNLADFDQETLVEIAKWGQGDDDESIESNTHLNQDAGVDNVGDDADE